MKIGLMTDPHVGFRPKSHVTSSSAARYQQEVLDRALEEADRLPATRFLLGDLFDKSMNPEHIIDNGAELASKFAVVMSGNHDVTNREGTVSSLELLGRRGSLGKTEVVFTHDGSQFRRIQAGADFFFLCHYYTQAQFEEAVRAACEAENDPEGRKRVLCLHCNVGDGHGTEVTGEQSSLYLTDELQKLVCEHFGLILVGHEHNHRVVRKKIWILGNHYPLGFDQMVTKHIWILDTETLEMTSIPCWDPKHSYVELSVGDLLDGVKPHEAGAEFIRLTGEAPAQKRAEIAAAVTQLWKSDDDCVLMAVRNDIVIHGGVASPAEVRRGSMNFAERLEAEAEAAGFAAEYEELRFEDTE